MNFLPNTPTLGMRSLKTALSTTLCAVLYALIGRNATFACIGAVFGMESEACQTPWRTGGNRLVGTIIGGALGIGLFYIKLQVSSALVNLLLLVAGIFLLLFLSQIFGCAGAIQSGAVVFYIVMLNTPSDQYIIYSLNRILDTAVGVGISVLINVLHLHLRRAKQGTEKIMHCKKQRN